MLGRARNILLVLETSVICAGSLCACRCPRRSPRNNLAKMPPLAVSHEGTNDRAAAKGAATSCSSSGNIDAPMPVAALSILMAIAFMALPARGAVDFARDVQPIFQKACYSCHSAEKQKGELRLDVKMLALKGGESGPAITPGKSRESLLIKLVRGEDEDRVMPAKGERLTAAQINTLAKWIDAGAAWPDDGVAVADKRDLWSLKPVTHREPPAVKNTSWARNDIDRFILARLEKEKLAPRPQANRRTLIRRVTFDLIGLPPTPEEVNEFVKDDSPNAYEKVVDRLLASPRFGERWARHWLDVVRYADSNGFEMNQPRPNAWPYRDWVIAAINSDMPYDEFVKEQITGEGSGQTKGTGASASYPNPNPQTLNPFPATGFLVAGAWDQVKSPDPGLTAQQRADELHDMVSVTSSTFLGLTVGCARCHDHKFDPISQIDYYRMTAIFAGVNHGEQALPVSARTKSALETAQKKLSEVGSSLRAFIAHDESSKLRPAVLATKNEERFAPVKARLIRFTISATNTGSEPCIDELEIFSSDMPEQNLALNAKLSSSGNYAGNPSHKLSHLNDGQYGNGRSWISNQAGKGWVQLELPAAVKIDHIIWGRDRNSQYTDRLATNYVIETTAASGEPWRVVASSDDRKPYAGGKAEKPRYVAKSPAEQRELSKLLTQHEALEKEVAQVGAPAMIYAGQFSQPGPSYRLNRGEALSPREQVTPGAIAILSPAIDLPANAPEQQRRAALANWIANEKNPLTARVIVNRLWQHHFARGIVATPSDFGHMGAKPTHPELLDYLASELMHRGWHLKAIHRMIVLSAAYRQSSESDPAARSADGDDALLWGYPPQRLEAEALRDSILSVSGKLDLKLGGPGFDLFKPNSNYVRIYEPKEEFGPTEFRRMIYAQKPRMQGDGVFAAFDCPDAGQTQPRRAVSTTPLQALNLLNSRFMLDQSEFFAKRLKRDAGSDVAAQVRLAFALAFGREPSPIENKAAAKLIQQFGLPAFCRAIYNANEFLYVN
jgi:mono/diheme cytochrome c family protein